MASTRYYYTATTFSALSGYAGETAANEVEASTTAPGSGSLSGTIGANQSGFNVAIMAGTASPHDDNDWTALPAADVTGSLDVTATSADLEWFLLTPYQSRHDSAGARLAQSAGGSAGFSAVASTTGIKTHLRSNAANLGTANTTDLYGVSVQLNNTAMGMADRTFTIALGSNSYWDFPWASGPPPVDGTATVTLPSATVSGTGLMQPEGTAAITLQPVTVDGGTGVVVDPIDGSSVLGLPGVTVSATGYMRPEGQGVISLEPVTVSATGEHQNNVTGTGPVNLPGIQVSATGALEFIGSASVTLPAAQVSGTGAQEFTGSAAATLSAVTVSADGYMRPEGTAALSLEPVTVSATGVDKDVGQAATLLPRVTVSASGLMHPDGSGAVTLPAAQVNATGAVAQNVGQGTVTLPSATVDGSGAEVFSGAAEVTLSAVTAAGSGLEVPEGTGAVTLPGLSVSAEGTHQERITGTAPVVLPAVTVSADGLHDSGTFEGTGVVNLPGIGLNVDGLMQPSGVAEAIVVPAVTVSGTGEQIPTRQGNAVINLPGLQVSGTGLQVPEGTGAVTLPGIQVNGTGQRSGFTATSSGRTKHRYRYPKGWMSEPALEPITEAPAVVSGQGEAVLPAIQVQARGSAQGDDLEELLLIGAL